MSGLCNILDKLTGCEDPEGAVASKDPKGRYSQITLDLDAAHTDEELHLAGSFIGVAFITKGGTCEIKLDHVHANPIDLRDVQHIKANFNRIYFTSDGRGGSASLYICQAMETVITPTTFTPFKGTTYNARKTSTNTVKRITATGQDIYLHKLQIRNTHATYGVDLGYVPTDSIPDTASFRAYAYRLIAQDDIEFTDVNIHELGFVSTVDDNHVTLKIIGTMH